MLDLTDGLIKLLVLAVHKIKLFLGSLNVSQEVRLRLVSLLSESLVQLDIGSLVLYLVLQGFDFDGQLLTFLLLPLETVSKKKTLLDSTFGCGGSVSDGLDQSITHVICTTAVNLFRACYVHYALIKLFLNHLIVCKPFLADRKFSFDISITLASSTLKLKVFLLQTINFRP